MTKRGIDKKEMYAVQRDSLRDEDDELDGELFDVVLVSRPFARILLRKKLRIDIPQCSQAYHHMPDLDAITKALSRRLKPNGSLLVVDLSSEGNFNHEKIVDDKSKFKDVVAHKHGACHLHERRAHELTSARPRVLERGASHPFRANWPLL